MTSLLLSAFIYLASAAVAVPLSKRLGLGSVLGYLIAGVLIGPVFGLVGQETESIQHVAEFGVVMMLFLVGLELEPHKLWQLRWQLLGLGGLQVVLTIAAITGIAMLMGLSWTVGVAAGCVLSMSSTAIVLQTLGEKNLLASQGGQASFSVLLFQDIAVIPMLALLPLLALPELAGQATEAAHHADAVNLLAGLPAYEKAGITFGVIALIVVGGHFLAGPIFRYIAAARLREIFTVVSLALVIGIAVLMSLIGLSPALGTFLAGVVLANSEYRHELESNIEPFKGLLLGLFFITVGAGVDFELLAHQGWKILGITLCVIVAKGLILLLLGKVFRLKRLDQKLFALALAQAGEFGFVLLSLVESNGVMPSHIAKQLLLIAGLAEARLLVVAIDNHEQAMKITEFARKTNPGIKIVARSYDAQQTYELYHAGADEIVRENFDSAVRCGKRALECLGMPKLKAEEVGNLYFHRNRHGMAMAAKAYDPSIGMFENKALIEIVRAEKAETERLIRQLLHDQAISWPKDQAETTTEHGDMNMQEPVEGG